MRLSPEEDAFLRQWMHDELHFLQGVGPAKRLQLEHNVLPADLALLIAAAMPDPSEQGAAGAAVPPAGPPRWPWTPESFRARVAEACALLAAARARGSGFPS
jgi:hypothetical protein